MEQEKMKKKSKAAMTAILFFKISQKIFKSKHYKLIAHCKLLKPILSEIETLLQKKNNAGHGNGSKKITTN